VGPGHLVQRRNPLRQQIEARLDVQQHLLGHGIERGAIQRFWGECRI
jgi:hypothetical protein